MHRTRRGRLALAGVFLLTLAAADARAAELVSRAAKICSSGSSDSYTGPRSLSADGRYLAYWGRSRNLVAGQSSRFNDLFLRDRVSGANVLVSRKLGSAATGGNGDSSAGVISADGNVVVFRSSARNLVAGQFGYGVDNLFVWERSSGAITLITHAHGSALQGSGGGTFSSYWLSQDGRYIAYDNEATDLVAGQVDANADSDVFLFDRTTGSSTLVSHSSSSSVTTGSSASRVAGLSADGRYLVFTSTATNLVPDGEAGTFLYDRVSGTRTRLAPDGKVAISADGNFVALSTSANLAPGQTDPQAVGDVYLYDRQAATFTLVSHASGAALTSGNRSSSWPALSGDGRYVAYLSDASNLVAGQTVQRDGQFFLFDRITGTSVLASHASASPTVPANEAWGGGEGPELSLDGRYVAFPSGATDLIPGQTGADFAYDLFLYDRDTGVVTMPSHAGGSPQKQTGGTSSGVLSADGAWLAFSSHSDEIDAGDCNASTDVFLHDRTTGTSRLASAHDPSSPALSGATRSFLAVPSGVSDDGRYAVLESDATNLAAGTDTNRETDVFLHDRETGTAVLVSGSAADPDVAANRKSGSASISADGRWVAFLSEASDLGASGPPGYYYNNVYLYDRVSRSRLLVSHSAASPTSAGHGWASGPADLSGDGRYVAYTHTSSTLVPGQIDSPDPYGSGDVFVFDRLTGTSSLISRAAGSAVQAAGGSSPRISADGRYVVFLSYARDLVPGAVYPDKFIPQVFLHDRRTGATTLVSRRGGLPPGSLQAGNGDCFAPVLSADGRFVAFGSVADDLVPGQADPVFGMDVFLFDQALGTVTLVSHAPGSPVVAANGASQAPSLSGDGTFVAFHSLATNLVAGQDTNGWYDVFLYDRRSGGNTLVSHKEGFPTVAGDSGSLWPSVSADGKVVFLSGAEDLESGSGPRAPDNTFLYDPASGENRLLSALQPASLGASFETTWTAAVSRNGRSAYFTSRGDLVPGDYNGLEDVFADHTTAPPTDLYTVAPCRLLDTRQGEDGPALISGVMELLAVHGECGIPATARALVANVTVLNATARGNLRFHEGGLAAPVASTINFAGGEIRANNAILPLTLAERGLGVTPLVVDGGTVHLILDVFGYFE